VDVRVIVNSKLYHGENKLHIVDMVMMSAFYFEDNVSDWSNVSTYGLLFQSG
jgi:hypothetical protein